MGRYSSVQAYADNHSSVRSISYEQATGVSQASSSSSGSNSNNNNGGSSGGPVVTEKVSNPYGSTAGAGSGDFHVYRHARAREITRWKELDAKEKEEAKQKQFDEKLKLEQQREEQKTAKRRQKRQKAKEAKLRKKTLMAAGIQILKASQPSTNPSNGEYSDGDGNGNKEEFSYTPMAQLRQQTQTQNEQEGDDGSRKIAPTSHDDNNGTTGNAKHNVGKAETTGGLEEIPNDGSFLEVMKKRLLDESNKGNIGVGEDEEGPLPLMSSAKRPKIGNDTNDSTDSTGTEQRGKAVMKVENRIIDEDDDDEEGPPLPPSMQK